jgi:hypothetical protein
MGSQTSVGSLMGALRASWFIEGLFARLMYVSLHLMHHQAVLGTLRTGVLALARYLIKRSTRWSSCTDARRGVPFPAIRAVRPYPPIAPRPKLRSTVLRCAPARPQAPFLDPPGYPPWPTAH